MKKIRPYLKAILLTSIILLIVFVYKDIFPFGKNTLIWGDMEDQVTAFLYHFYDSILGNKSMFFDFTTSLGINFVGVLGYYLISPFSLLVLLFGRNNIYLSISIIIALKIILASITSLYAIRKSFKNIPEYIGVLMATSYALCGFSIIMYQITAWADIVYLFPLLFLGLKKVLDGEKPTLYIVILSLGLIMCFYLNILLLIYIYIMALVYLYFYRKDKMKKGILNLGLSTVISVLIASCVLIPSYMQIGESGRASFDINEVFNAKFNMMTDKVLLFITIGVPLGILLYYLIKNLKKNDKTTKYILVNLIIFLIPVLIEPVNKMLHLGSYALFPLRCSFIIYFFVIYGALYYLDKDKEVDSSKGHNIIFTIVSLIYSGALIVTTVLNYSYFEHQVSNISIGNHYDITLIYLAFIVASTLITYLMLRNKGYSKFDFINLYMISIVTMTCMSFIYFGMSFRFNYINNRYDSMNDLYNENLDYYRVKSDYVGMVQNYGYVADVNTLDHFTSLTKRETMYALRRLGYSSYWVKTFSTCGTLFTDAVLGNKYYISDYKINNDYYEFVKKIDNIYLYKNKLLISYGYLMDHNEELDNDNNPSENINKLYYGLTGDNNIMNTYDTVFDSENLEITEKDGYHVYKFIDKNMRGKLHTSIHVSNEEVLYLYLFKNIDNNINKNILDNFNIYVNGILYKDKYPKDEYNGLIELGTFKDKDVTIDIEVLKEVAIKDIIVTSLDLDKYEKFVTVYNQYTDVKYNKNKMIITYTGNQGTLFIPYIYNENFKVKVNNEDAELKRVFSDFIGVDVKNGLNEIEITYDYSYLYKFIAFSIFIAIVTFILLKSGIYMKILDNKLLGNIGYYIYLFGYLVLFVVMYFIPTLAFIISFFYTFKF